MNYGAYLLDEFFLTSEETKNLESLALKLVDQSTPTHNAGKYASSLWSFIPLTHGDETKDIAIPEEVRSPEVQKILSHFKTSISLGVFYYLRPGGKLHPHRDLTGAKLNDRIRFHIPIKTNSKVLFNVAGERIIMKAGTLWALDTSYVHSVENAGDEVRVHIVIECNVNDWCRSILAKPNLKTKLHDFYYACYLLTAIVKSLLINVWKDPTYLAAQFSMGLKFIKWRFLKRK